MRTPFEQSAEWWLLPVPDGSGRLNRDLGPTELMRQHGDLTVKGWDCRLQVARERFPHVAFPKLRVGAKPQGATIPSREACPLDEVRLLRALESSASIIDLANEFDCAPSRVEAAVEYLRTKHIIVAETAAGLTVAREIPHRDDAHRIDTAQFAEQEFCFGLTADNHIGSKYERLDVLEDLADRWAAAGATRVLIAGNWIDGSGRRFNEHDIYVHGVTEQVGNFIDRLPKRDGMEWDVLSGDDHEGWYVQDQHVNIGHVLEDEALRAGRTDIHDLGYMERDIELAQPYGSAILRMAHAGGGTAYAISYTAQKYVEALQGGEKPKVVILGHYHKFDYSYPREVHAIQPGCTQDQTPFMRKRKIPAHLGGCLLRIRQNELGIITSVGVDWWPYYDRKFYAYQWKRPEEA